MEELIIDKKDIPLVSLEKLNIFLKNKNIDLRFKIIDLTWKEAEDYYCGFQEKMFILYNSNKFPLVDNEDGTLLDYTEYISYVYDSDIVYSEDGKHSILRDNINIDNDIIGIISRYEFEKREDGLYLKPNIKSDLDLTPFIVNFVEETKKINIPLSIKELYILKEKCYNEEERKKYDYYIEKLGE